MKPSPSTPKRRSSAAMALKQARTLAQEKFAFLGNGSAKQPRPIEPIYGLVALKMRHIRETLGMQQDELAKRVGYTRTSIVNIESGRQRLPLHQVEEIARALGVTTKHLLRGIWT